jgi:hypothetical protein
LRASYQYGRPIRYEDLDYNVDWFEVTNLNAENRFYHKDVFIRSTKPIYAGEELYIDYGDGYWRAVIETEAPPESFRPAPEPFKPPRAPIGGDELQRMIINAHRRRTGYKDDRSYF